MSALGEISKRLKTDIAETARASIDPVYSRQLTQRNFRKQERIERREDSLIDAQRAREQQLVNEERQTKHRVESLAMGKAVESGLSSGDWTGVANLIDSGKLSTDSPARYLGDLMVSSKLPQGFDYAYKSGKLELEQRKVTAAELANQLKAEDMDDAQKNRAQKLLLEKRKHSFDIGVDARERAEGEGDVSVIQEYFNNPANLSDDERSVWAPRVKGQISPNQAVNIMDAFLKERSVLNKAEADRISGRGSNKDIQAFKYFDTSLKKQTKPMTEAIRDIGEIKQLLSQEPTAVTNKAITSKVSELFDNKVRALANLQEWKNLGDIGQKIGGTVKNIVYGGRLESQYGDILAAITPYEKELIRSRNTVKADIYDQAVDGYNIPAEHLFPEDHGQRFEHRDDPEGRPVKIDMWRQTVEYLD
ncbi:MAG: hypothetical protein GY941_15800 [Planctomycetes bacterium]|nr:hypothetical protein [Planctomycetota bacterium]